MIDEKKLIEKMTYFEHLKVNWKVAFHSLNDFFEHFLHGLIPFIKWQHATTSATIQERRKGIKNEENSKI